MAKGVAEVQQRPVALLGLAPRHDLGLHLHRLLHRVEPSFHIPRRQRRAQLFAQLRELIGSADGRQFRVFAQSLTLRLQRRGELGLASLDGLTLRFDTFDDADGRAFGLVGDEAQNLQSITICPTFSLGENAGALVLGDVNVARLATGNITPGVLLKGEFTATAADDAVLFDRDAALVGLGIRLAHDELIHFADGPEDAVEMLDPALGLDADRDVPERYDLDRLTEPGGVRTPQLQDDRLSAGPDDLDAVRDS